MPGFPIRPTRVSFGPVPKDRHAVRDPKEEMGAGLADLIFFQLAGAGAMVDRAWCTVLGADGELIAAAESWDPDNAGDDPVTSRSGAGTYVVEYPALAADKDGAEQSVVLLAAKATPQSTTNFTGHAKVRPDGRTVDVVTRNAAGAAADCDFLLEVK